MTPHGAITFAAGAVLASTIAVVAFDRAETVAGWTLLHDA